MQDSLSCGSKKRGLHHLVRAHMVGWCCLLVLTLGAQAQTARISDAWWTFDQDCDGDGNRAGTLAGGFARLNWFPDVNNCSGTLMVREKIQYRPCGTLTWISLYTNELHQITGCVSTDVQYLDIEMGTNGECREYMISIYREGQSLPDYRRSNTNDVHLAQHREESLAFDLCASDTFANCMALAGKVGSLTDNTMNATKQPGEPDHANNPGGHSVWYCWTAPTNQPVTFSTIGSGFDTLLAVYTGNDLATLNMVTNNDDIAGATNRMSRVGFTPTTGTTYRIAVDGFGGAAGNVELSWNQAGGSLPDLIIWGPGAAPFITTTTFAPNNCQVLEGCATVGTRRLLRFNMETRNIGNVDLVIGNPANNPLFYFASCHNHYHFESFAQYTLLDTNYNPVILDTNVVVGRKMGFAIVDVARWLPSAPSTLKYSGNNNGIQAGWADVYTQDLDCQFIDITGVPAGEYYLQITVNPDGLFAEADLQNNTAYVPVTIPPTNCLTAPVNDAFASPAVIDTTPFSAVTFNDCATTEVGEPAHAGITNDHSLWYRWTPDSNHTAVITTRRSDFDTVLAVYTGEALEALTLIASNNNIAGANNRQSLVTFPAEAGVTYHIAAAGFSNAVGSLVLNINPPANDDFANRFVIAGPAGSVTGNTRGASKEPTETAHATDVGGASVWYEWNAPASGFVDFNTLGSAFDTIMAVYTNATVNTNNLPIAQNDDDAQGGGLQTSRAWFYAFAGTNYYIAVDGFGGDVGPLKLNWNMNCLLTITNLPGGDVQLALTGVDWQRYVLLGSTNLLDWYTNTAAITMTEGVRFYTNSPSAANNPSRREFYRALLVP
ncbi:MAG TPA: lysyl oxidase family protein [Verrucomicrobiae bacterium]|nr:lysyl oxidase family protein [Verrucomicrobiae bacterium]